MIKVSPTFVHFRGIRVRKVHIKIVLAFGGAFLMGMDAAVTWAGPVLFPVIFHQLEFTVAALGKTGAFAAGIVPFFEGLLKQFGEEVAEDAEAGA